MGTCFGTEAKLQDSLHVIGIAWSGVPVFKEQKPPCHQWCLLVGLFGTNIDVKMLLACYWSNLKSKGFHNLDLDTEDTMWKHIQWDLEACFNGVHTNTDALGNAWPIGCK